MANDQIKSQIEAALFLTEKPIKAQAVARIVNADVNIVRQLIIELIHDYESRGGALEVADDDGYIIQVKDEYTHYVDEFVPIDMPTALIRTLSAIAIKQPAMQSEIIKIRGAGAYDHIKELLARELISKREEGGRSPMLTTTKKFQEYFRLSKDGKSIRQELSGLTAGSSKGKDNADEVGVEGQVAAIGETETTTVQAPIVADTPATVAGTEAPAIAEVEATPAVEAEDEESEIDTGNTFDASPDPDTPPIGTSVADESTTDDVNTIVDTTVDVVENKATIDPVEI